MAPSETARAESSRTPSMHDQTTSPTQKRTRGPVANTSLPCRTRVKMSPPDQEALLPAAHSSESKDTTMEDCESSSELSESSEDTSSPSSSDEESSEEESEGENNSDGAEHSDENKRINVVPGKREKPNPKYIQNDEFKALKARLDAFLPKMAAANEELERQRQAGTLKTLEAADNAEGEYIELNLGLGVLEEKDPNAPHPESSDHDDDADDDEDSESDAENMVGQKKQPKEKDILGKLMGQERKKDGNGIQEMDGT